VLAQPGEDCPVLDGVPAPVTEPGADRPALDGVLGAVKVKALSEPDKERLVLDGVLVSESEVVAGGGAAAAGSMNPPAALAAASAQAPRPLSGCSWRLFAGRPRFLLGALGPILSTRSLAMLVSPAARATSKSSRSALASRKAATCSFLSLRPMIGDHFISRSLWTSQSATVTILI
jgi:hypothetical protein